MDNERQKALDTVIKNMEKSFGKGAVMKLGDNKGRRVSSTSSGSVTVDNALGVGGYPKGRIIEIYGPESSGKTTVALHAIAEVQKNGGVAAFIDAEHALDPVYAQALGVDIDNLYLSQPDHGEQGLEIAEAFVRSGAVDIVVVDSVQALRKLSGAISKSNTTAIFINQIREKVGVMFGNPETTPGGRALKFYSSVRLEVRRAEQLKQGQDIVGNRTKIKVVKNKVAPPFRVAEVDIMYGQGISKEGELIDLGVENDIVDKSGAWYSYNGDRMGQGKENVKNYLKENPQIKEEIDRKLREKLGIFDGDVDENENEDDSPKTLFDE